jgi:hypothetical protein
MSALDHACEVISEAGCYAGNEIRERAEFDRIDRQGRIAVAAKDLVNWLDGSLPRIFDIDAVAELVATAMLRQHDHDEKERIERQIEEHERCYAAADAYWHGPDSAIEPHIIEPGRIRSKETGEIVWAENGNTTDLDDDAFNTLVGDMLVVLQDELHGWDTTGDITPKTLRKLLVAAVGQLTDADFAGTGRRVQLSWHHAS